MKGLLFLLCVLPVILKGQIITTVAGTGIQGFGGDGGLAIVTTIGYPDGITVDRSGNILFCEWANARVRKIDGVTGIMTTIAGDSAAVSLGDGGLATQASLWGPAAVCIDTVGNIYIGDDGHQRVRKIDTSGIITTIAGSGVFGYSGDGGPATSASFQNTGYICLDHSGSLYISDCFNYRVRKVNLSTGIITTYAGTGTNGYSGDGGLAINAKISRISGICVDSIGDVFIGDWDNGRIRKIDTAGIITTFAGIGTVGYSGDGGSANNAMFRRPNQMFFDHAGNFYFADTYNNRIRKISAQTNIITTVAGDGPACGNSPCGGYGGDGGPADSAYLNTPLGLCTDAVGNLYISDYDNHRIRKVNYSADGVGDIKPIADIAIFPNPAQLQITITGLNNTKTISIINTLGQMLITQQVSTSQTTIDISRLKEGVYFLSIKDPQTGVATRQKFIKE